MTLAASSLHLLRGQTRALAGVSLGLAPRQITAILGPNGAGKSTLLACLAGLSTPDSGTVTLKGQPLAALAPRQRARAIGYLPQSADIHWDIDVQTLVTLGRTPWRGRFSGHPDDAAAVARALEQTGLTTLAGRVVNTLSGGERSRALLARVLAGQPGWLLADEPLASLDPAHQADVLALLRKAASAGAGVALVLHDLNQAARIADHVVLMRAGEVVAEGPPDTVLTPPLIAQTYGVAAHIGHLPDGQRFIVTGGRA
ncbi:MAG: ABC transporter ATP-binding protein [Polymorphobacter sp.]|uniref:ABC transporter ATP-binding protein n=1 Tax=Polymorphobacter sp. TaxID=1909290 RepID=UPI003A898D54